MKFLWIGITTGFLVVSPALARTPLEGGPVAPEVRFLECDHQYWLHRGLSDSLYYGSGGSFASAHSDRFQGRDPASGGSLRLWRNGKTPVVTEWLEVKKVLEIPLEGDRTP